MSSPQSETASNHSLAETVQDDHEAQQPPLLMTPLPRAQLAALCLARLADPINFSQIFPYINEFLAYLHVTDDIERIGFYSGLVESMFAICQLLTIHHWSKLSDRIGRRPVIALGMIGLAVATMGFGLSHSLASLVLFRGLGGLVSGNVATVHVVLGELTDQTNQHIAFPLYGVMWPLGNVLGPVIGGLLVHPADSFPRVFNNPFFRHNPYFLPSFASAVIAIFTATVIWAFLKETNPSQLAHYSRLAPEDLNRKDYGTIRSFPRSTSSSTIAEEESPSPKLPQPHNGIDASIWHLLSIKPIRALCLSGCAMCLEGMSFDVIFVLFSFTPVENGGLGFSSQGIGAALSFAGIVGVLLQIAIMPPLLRRYNTASLYLVVMALWPFIYLLFPVLATIRRSSADTNSPALLLVLGITLLLSKIGNLGYSLSLVLVKLHSPHPRALASTNSLVQSAMLISRSIAPIFISSLFALSIGRNLLGGHLWVVVMVLLCFVGYGVSLGLKESSKDKDPSSESVHNYDSVIPE